MEAASTRRSIWSTAIVVSADHGQDTNRPKPRVPYARTKPHSGHMPSRGIKGARGKRPAQTALFSSHSSGVVLYSLAFRRLNRHATEVSSVVYRAAAVAVDISPDIAYTDNLSRREADFSPSGMTLTV